MKKIDFLLLSLYMTGVIYMADWLLFCEQNDQYFDDFPTMKTIYVNRFPEFVQPLLTKTPQPAAIIFTIVFLVCGAVFIRRKALALRILAIMAFIFGLWNLFSIM